MVFQKQRVLGQAEEMSTGNLGCRSKLPADWQLQNELVGLVGSHKMTCGHGHHWKEKMPQVRNCAGFPGALLLGLDLLERWLAIPRGYENMSWSLWGCHSKSLCRLLLLAAPHEEVDQLRTHPGRLPREFRDHSSLTSCFVLSYCSRFRDLWGIVGGGCSRAGKGAIDFLPFIWTCFPWIQQPVGFISSAMTHPHPPPLHILPDSDDFEIPCMGERKAFCRTQTVLWSMRVCEGADSVLSKGDSEPQLRQINVKHTRLSMWESCRSDFGNQDLSSFFSSL